jgi:hypothetical protein
MIHSAAKNRTESVAVPYPHSALIIVAAFTQSSTLHLTEKPKWQYLTIQNLIIMNKSCSAAIKKLASKPLSPSTVPN